MIDQKSLDDMANISIEKAAQECLHDIRNTEIIGETSYQRLESYISQIGNPYCFCVGKTAVRVSFKTSEKTLEKKILGYFLSLKI